MAPSDGGAVESSSRRRRRGPAAVVVALIFFVFLLLPNAAAWRQKVPSAPRNLNVIPFNATAYRLTWSPPEFANGQIFGYYVYQDKLINGAPIANGRRKAAALMNANANSTLISDLEPNTEYVLRVNAVNANGDGEYASTTHFLTGRSPPAPPRVISVGLVDDSTPVRARVGWLPAEERRDGASAPVAGYMVWWRPRLTPQANWQSVEVAANEKSAVLDNLLMGTEYELLLASFNEDGRSENVSESLNTPIGRPNGTPLNVRYSIQGDKLSFQWDPPHATKQNGAITGYHPVLACSDKSAPQHQKVNRLWTSYTINTQKQYSFRIAASTEKGDGPFSDQIKIDPASAGVVGKGQQNEN